MINRIGKASANGSVPKDKKNKAATSAAKCTGGAANLKTTSDEDAGTHTTEGTDILAKEFQKLEQEVGEALKTCDHHLINQSHGASAIEHNSSSGGAATTTRNGHISPQPNKSSRSASKGLPDGSGQAAGGCTADKSSLAGIEDEYCAALRQAQFDSIEFQESGPSKHFFQAEFAKAESPSYQSICRVAQDIASLASKGSLPLNPSSSIFVRSDENKSNLLKCIITGPEGTPYTGGVYEFDIFFPNKYPTAPPKVHFRTTGGGTVRFNPNLYNEGKVCLSLLGTWDGAQGENWNQHTSNILQVLISIQSLILCPEPYYNEPGFERKYGTEFGDAQCAKYNEECLKNNLKFAISDAIKCPPVGFEEAVNIHFYLKKHQLIKELEQQSEGKSKSLKKIVAEVTSELLNIQKPKALIKKK
jgi:ubiquitin-protein ligase